MSSCCLRIIISPNDRGWYRVHSSVGRRSKYTLQSPASQHSDFREESYICHSSGLKSGELENRVPLLYPVVRRAPLFESLFIGRKVVQKCNSHLKKVVSTTTSQYMQAPITIRHLGPLILHKLCLHCRVAASLYRSSIWYQLHIAVILVGGHVEAKTRVDLGLTKGAGTGLKIKKHVIPFAKNVSIVKCPYDA